MRWPMPYPPPGLSRGKNHLRAQTRIAELRYLLAVALLLMLCIPARAITEVSDCTEEALRTAIEDAALDDGIVVFTDDCSITLSNTIVINTNLWAATTNPP